VSAGPWILALETATNLGGVALMRGELLRGRIVANMQGAHSRRLLRDARALLTDEGIDFDALSAVAVDRGPGSFTGLRVGMATAKGLCLAASVPLVGVSSLEALAHGVCGWVGLVAATLDARKGEVYGSLLRAHGDGSRESVVGDCLARPESWAARVTKHASDEPVLWLGVGARLYAEVLLGASPAGSRLAHPAWDAPDPAWVAILGQRRLAQHGADPLDALEPDYLRASDAELALGARLAAAADSPAANSPSGSPQR